MTDEDIVDRMERGIPPEDEDEARRRGVYARLITMIRELSDMPLPGWEERTAARWLEWQSRQTGRR